MILILNEEFRRLTTWQVMVVETLLVASHRSVASYCHLGTMLMDFVASVCAFQHAVY